MGHVSEAAANINVLPVLVSVHGTSSQSTPALTSCDVWALANGEMLMVARFFPEVARGGSRWLFSGSKWLVVAFRFVSFLSLEWLVVFFLKKKLRCLSHTQCSQLARLMF